MKDRDPELPQGSRGNTPLGPALTFAALLVLLWPAAVRATPTPPVLLVNHETRECSQAIQGDDCSWCEPPAGWQVAGAAGEASCPQGYSMVDTPALECRRYETPFCCSGGAHRGDCEDMIVDQDAAMCGFVDELAGCTLPDNWQARPRDVQVGDWVCPVDYGWVQEEIACLPGAAQTLAEATSVAEEDPEATTRGICFGLSCLLLASLLIGAAAIFPVWYVARQKDRRMLPPGKRR